MTCDKCHKHDAVLFESDEGDWVCCHCLTPEEYAHYVRLREARKQKTLEERAARKALKGIPA
jgi:uncharacterized Zn finger protein (UPF0148 family)